MYRSVSIFWLLGAKVLLGAKRCTPRICCYSSRGRSQMRQLPDTEMRSLPCIGSDVLQYHLLQFFSLALLFRLVISLTESRPSYSSLQFSSRPNDNISRPKSHEDTILQTTASKRDSGLIMYTTIVPISSAQAYWAPNSLNLSFT